MKLPPVIVFALPVLIGWAADRLWPVTGFSFAAQDVIAAVILLCGVGLLLLAVTGFRLKKTTVNPLDPGQASALVDDGIYRISRNPMYLGMALFVLGVGLGQGWSVTIALLPFAIWYINQNQILPEEAALRSRFGADYEHYCQRVRRLI